MYKIPLLRLVNRHSMAGHYDMSTTSFNNKCYQDDGTMGRILVSDGPGSGVRVQKPVVVGLSACMALILIGLGVNLYFAIAMHKEYALARKQTNCSRTELDSQLSVLSNIDSSEGNLTKAGQVTLLNMATRVDALTSSLSQLDGKMDKMSDASVNDKNTLVQALSRHQDQLDIVTHNQGSIIQTLYNMENKVDNIVDKVNASRTHERFMDHYENQRNNTGLWTILQELTTIIEEKTDGLQTALDSSLLALSLRVDRVLSSMVSMQNRLDDIDDQLILSNTSIAAIHSAVNVSVPESLKQIELLMMSNKEHIQTGTENVVQLTNITQMQHGQTGHQLDSMTLKMNSVSERLENIENGLKDVNLTVSESKDIRSNLNGTFQEHTLDFLRSIQQSIMSTEGHTESNHDALRELVNQTMDLSRGVTTIQQSTLNIFDQLTLVVDTSLQELNRKMDTVSDLQRVSHENHDFVNSSITQLKQQSKSHYEQTLHNISFNINMQSEIIKPQLDAVVTQINQLLANCTGSLEMEIGQITQAVRNLVNESICTSIDGRLKGLESRQIDTYVNISTAIQSLLQSGDRPDIDVNVSRRIDVIEELAQSINASLTLPESKLRNASLSSAILDMVRTTNVVYESVMSASRLPPVCNNDGCFYKTIPVGLVSTTSSLVQKHSIRLADAEISSGSIRGRLEVYRGGTWGTVCDDSFQNVDAKVVCRMFGYTSGLQKQSAFFGAGSGSILMDDVDCSGSETSIFSCRYTSSHNCGHTEDVGVICT